LPSRTRWARSPGCESLPPITTCAPSHKPTSHKPTSPAAHGSYTAQFFLSKYGPRFKVSYGICIAFVGGVVIANSWTWYWQYGLEKETRRIARLRRQAGKDGVVAVEELKAA